MEGFSQMEVSVIRNMMHSRSFKDIAAVLDRSKEEISECVSWIADGTEIIPHQTILDERAAAQKRPPRVRVPKPKTASPAKLKKADKEKIDREKKKELKKANQQERMRVDHERAKIRAESRGRFLTREVDYTNMHMVKVCKGTYVYANPGETDQQAIDRYYRTYKKPATGG